MADRGSQEEELIEEDLGTASWGKGTWMKDWEQEPLVARITRYNPRPEAHARDRKRRRGKQNGVS